jgi:sterol desaturase/sphingolipid hydroxylase (fatty acid hydroxylase superfamily)
MEAALNMIDWIANQFAALQDQLFESTVLPAMHALGLGGYVEQAFNWTEVFLIGAIEVTLLAIVLGALEKWRPVEMQVDNDDKRVDVLYTLLNRLGLIPLLLFLLLQPLVDVLDSWLRLHDLIPPKLEDWLPFLNDSPLLSFLFYLLILDFVAYWLHRSQHRINAWWALHSLHHSQRQLSFWSDNRNHLLDVVAIDTVFALVALAIGVAPGQFITIIVATRVVESLSHANLRLSFGRIGDFLLVSPHFHRVHHAIGMGHEGAYSGCNFAILFPLWDWLFGTLNREPNYPPTGVSDQLLGADYGSRFWAQQWLGLTRLAVSIRRSLKGNLKSPTSAT